MRTLRSSLMLLALVVVPAGLHAEPMFLSKQYARCTTCHYSPTGGGLLTPYGRSLSHNELSTTGGAHSSGASAPKVVSREQEFLYGALSDSLGKLHLGIDIRPARVQVDFPGGSVDRNFLMNADLLAAFRDGPWSVYAQAGREPLDEGGRFKSYEYWASYESESGLGIRAGRFFPAFGIRLADHTAFTRRNLGLDRYDQIYGIELSRAGQKDLLQVSVGPGRADSVLDDDGRRSFTASARYQRDLGTRTVLVASALHRAAADLAPRSTVAGLAFGFAPHQRLNVWNEGDVQFVDGDGGTPSYIFLNETSFEVYRGIWLKVSPQIATVPGDSSAGVFRWMFGVNAFPRTHYNIDIAFYRDRVREVGLVTKTWLFQLHLYL